MKLFHKAKDGGPDSNVTGYWLLESKKFFSIVLLKFSKGSREAYHTHAFNAVSWVLKGAMYEYTLDEYGNDLVTLMRPSVFPIYTPRERLHRVFGFADSTWVISFRGPWVDKWKEYFIKEDKYVTLTHGRKVI